jgi:hypothetical protein
MLEPSSMGSLKSLLVFLKGRRFGALRCWLDGNWLEGREEGWDGVKWDCWDGV